jgi:hypothetical protein
MPPVPRIPSRTVKDVHLEPRGDLVESGLVHARGNPRGKVVEISDHSGRRVEIQLPAVRVEGPEGMDHALRHVDERAGRTVELLPVHVHPVASGEHEEGLGTVAMDVQGRTAADRRLRGLDQRELTGGRRGVRMDDDVEPAEVDDPCLAGSEHRDAVLERGHRASPAGRGATPP